MQYVCQYNKGVLFRLYAAQLGLENHGLKTWKREGGMEAERRERREWMEEEKKCGESSGLDCKWDSTSRFTRKINESVTCACLCEYKSFSVNNQTLCVFMIFQSIPLPSTANCAGHSGSLF